MPQRLGERNTARRRNAPQEGQERASHFSQTKSDGLSTADGGTKKVDKADVDKADTDEVEGKGAPTVNSARCAWFCNLIGKEMGRCLT